MFHLLALCFPNRQTVIVIVFDGIFTKLSIGQRFIANITFYTEEHTWCPKQQRVLKAIVDNIGVVPGYVELYTETQGETGCLLGSILV